MEANEGAPFFRGGVSAVGDFAANQPPTALAWLTFHQQLASYVEMARATPPAGQCLPSHGNLASEPSIEAKRAGTEVIDLTSPTSSPAAGSTCFRASNLRSFRIGERLGATRDGGEGFQVRCGLGASGWVCSPTR